MILEAHVHFLEGVADGIIQNTREPRRSKTGAAQQYGAAFLMRSLLLSRRLRDQSTLAGTVLLAINLLPPGLRDLAKSLVDAGAICIPSQSTLQRFQLVYDVGIMMWRRSLCGGEAVCRYGFADSSPQGGRDWFLVKTACIKSSQIVTVMEAVHELAVDGAMQATQMEGDEPELPESTTRRTELFHLIESSMYTLTSPPVAFGQAKTCLQDKAAAFLFTHFLESGWEHIKPLLASFTSFTSDMGT